MLSMEEENTEETQGIRPSFLIKPQNPAAMMDTHGVQKSLHVFRRSRRRRCREGSGGAGGLMMIKEEAVKEVKGKGGGGGVDCTVEEKEEEADGEGEKDEREEVERKIHALQRIVPGGESFGVDKLFDETAGYIMALQYQVKALKALTGFFDKLEKEKTKLGG